MAKSSKKEEKVTKSAAKDVKKKEADTSTHAAQQKVAEQKAPKNSSKKTRTETDLLGSLEVPADAYYGVHTVRAMENFQISYVTINTIPALHSRHGPGQKGGRHGKPPPARTSQEEG